MSKSLVACCGLVCTECPAYEATRTGDRAAAERTAAEWAEQFGITVGVEDVWCDGCTEPGRKCAHCGECGIRSCALGRTLPSCAACEEYPCTELEGFFAMVPRARESLDRLRG